MRHTHLLKGAFWACLPRPRLEIYVAAVGNMTASPNCWLKIHSRKARPPTKDHTDALLRPGSTCWRVARASGAALIVDAADYFLQLRAALTGAERVVYLMGWDFDLRIELMPGQSDDGGIAPDG